LETALGIVWSYCFETALGIVWSYCLEIM
jgi:hypothetical protein